MCVCVGGIFLLWRILMNANLYVYVQSVSKAGNSVQSLHAHT